MRRNALTRALTALLAVGLLATTLPPGPALGYQSDRPRQLAMETENRLARAENTPDLELAIAAYRDILHNMDLIVADHPDSEQAATIRAGKPLRGQELLVRARIETRLANAERQYNVGPCFEQPAADCLLDLTVDFAGFKPETRDQVTLDPGEADLRDLVLIRLVAAQARAGLADRALALRWTRPTLTASCCAPRAP